MIEISHEVALTLLAITGGFILWLLNMTATMYSIKATVQGDLKRLNEDTSDLKKSVVNHDRRIQRLEDSRPDIQSEGHNL